MSKSNYAKDIEEVLNGEPVEAIVISKPDWYRMKDDPRAIPAEKCGVPLSWDEARPLLDYEYNDGYGGEDCHPFYAWTPTRVILCGCYDGSTWVTSVPRNAEACDPGFVGGG